MFNKKRIIIFVVFILLMFFMMTFAGEPVQNAAISTRDVVFTDGYNGKDIASFEVEVGEDVTPPVAPKHENFVFTGWYEYTNRNNKVTSFTSILNDLHVIALYGNDLNNNGILDDDEEHFLVTFVNSMNKEVLKEEEVLIGMDATAPIPPTIDNYNFVGWDRTYTNVKSDITVNTIYSRIARTNTDPVDNTNYFTVTFVDGDTNKKISSVRVREGLSAGTPTPPKHEGRVFDKWEGTYTNVRSNQTVTAIYTDDKNHNGEKDYLEDHYTIKFESTGRGHLEGKTEYNYILTGLTFDEAGIDVPKTIADEYYKFDKWTPTFAKVTKDETYVASFTPINDEISKDGGKDNIADEEQEYTLTINYVFKDGKTSLDSYKETRKYDNRDYKIESPKVEHYTADKTSVNGTIGSDGKLDRVETITYTRNTYTVTFKNYDDKVLKTEKVEAEASATAPENPTRENTDEFIYTFDGWDKTFDKIVSDTVVTAKYTSVKQEYKVTVEPNCDNGENCTKPEDEIVKYGDKVTLPNLERKYTLTYKENENVKDKQEGKTLTAELLGYCANSKECDKVVKAGTEVEVKDNVTYYAVWNDKGLKVNVVAGNGYETKEVIGTFKEWTNQEENKVSGETKIIKDEVLTASYDTVKQEYKVVVEPNCDNGENCTKPEDEIVKYGDKVTLPNLERKYTLTYKENENVKDKQEGKTLTAELLGYCANSKECDKVVKAGTEVEVKDNVTYYAVWNDKGLKVNVVAGNGYETKEVIGTFKEWTNQEENKVSGETKIIKDEVLTASYDTVKQEYKVTIDPNCEGDKCTPDNPETHKYGDKVTLPNLERKFVLTYKEAEEVEVKQNAKEVSAELLGYCINNKTCDEKISVGTEVEVKDNVTYYAVWNEEGLDVKVVKGNDYKTPTTEYTFVSWTSENSKEVKENDIVKVNKNMTLTAKYSDKVREYKLTIKYVYSDNKEAAETYMKNVANGTAYSVESPVIVGYTADTLKVEGKMPTKDVEVTVTYSANTDTKYIVEYYKKDLNKETYSKVDFEEKTGTTDKTVVLDENVLNSKYEGFKLNKNAEGTKLSGVITGDGKLVLKVYYDREEYKVVVDPNCEGDSCTPGEEEKHEYDEEITLGNLNRKFVLTYKEAEEVEDKQEAKEVSATLLGYCKNTKECDTLIPVGSKVKVTENSTYYAVWNEEGLDVKVVKGNDYKTPTTEYTFVSWTSENSKEVKENDIVKVNKNMTLTAKYSDKVREYKLTIKYVYSDNKEAAETYMKNVANGTAYSVESPVIVGYTADTLKVEGKMPTKDVEVTVTYSANTDTKYIVEYYKKDLNKETYSKVDFEEKTGTTDKTVVLDENVLNSKYEGFKLNKNAEGTKLSGVITGDGKLVLKVYYDREEYKVVVDPNCEGDSCTPGEEEKHEYDEEITLGNLNRKFVLTYKEAEEVEDKQEAKEVSATLLGYCKNTKECETLIPVGSKVKVTENSTYYAVWDESGLKVNAAKGNDYKTTNKDFKFIDWKNDKSTVQAGDELIVNKNLTLVAEYLSSTRKYPLVINYYFDNELDSSKTKTENVEYGKEVNSSTYATSFEHYKVEKTTPEKLTISENDNVINIYYKKIKAIIDVTTKVEANNPSEYGDTLVYTITLKNTGEEAGDVILKDKLLMKAIADGSVILSDDNHESVSSILTEEGYKLTVEPNENEEITLKVIVHAQAGQVCESQISYTVNGGSEQTTEKIVVNIEKTISIIEKNEITKGSNIVIVLDRSMSMDGDRIKNAKIAVESYIKNTFTTTSDSNGSQLYVVTFGTNYDSWSRKHVPYSKIIGEYSGWFSSFSGKADDYDSSLELIDAVRDISNTTADQTHGSGTPYYKGLEKAYELLFGSNGKGGMAKEKPNNNNVVIFLSDGAPDSSDSTSERNKYIANLKSKGAVTYSIGYGEIEKGDTAYNVLLSVSNNIEDNTYIASVSGISDVFDDINGRVNNTGSSTTSKGVAKISENITVDVNHPIEIIVNGELKHTFTTIKAAIDSKIIVKESDNSYNIDATKFNPGDKIVISYYNLNN